MDVVDSFTCDSHCCILGIDIRKKCTDVAFQVQLLLAIQGIPCKVSATHGINFEQKATSQLLLDKCNTNRSIKTPFFVFETWM